MRRYWLPKEMIAGTTVRFEGDSFHHIFDVCRQEVGSKFEVLGDGRKAHLVQVTAVEKKRAQASIIETRELPLLKKPEIILCLSIPRYPVFDAVIEKAVEMGVSRIQPFYSDFSFIRSKNSLPTGKFERWNKIVISGTQQSGRGELMEIHEPVHLDEILNKINQNSQIQGLFAYEGESTMGIKQHLNSNNFAGMDEVWIFVGSEGGFSSTEVEKMHTNGLHSVTLGDQVLRVETACIALIAILKYQFGQLE